MSLKEVITDVADRHDVCDPRKLAVLVSNSVSAEEVRDLFAEAIVESCRHHLMGRRNDAFDGVGREVRRTNFSARVQRSRDWWAEFKAAPECIGDNEWKPLGECTVADLRATIEARKENIRRAQVRVDQHERLLALMLKHGATQVRDLSRDVVDKELFA